MYGQPRFAVFQFVPDLLPETNQHYLQIPFDYDNMFTRHSDGCKTNEDTMTDIFRTPEKMSMKTRLFSIAVETLENAGWKVERVQRQLPGWTPAGVAAAVTAIARADEQVKGGGTDAGYALEQAVLAIVAARGGA